MMDRIKARLLTQDRGTVEVYQSPDGKILGLVEEIDHKMTEKADKPRKSSHRKRKE